MTTDIKCVLQMEVPIIVLLGERSLSVREVVELAPGSIIELPKSAEDELELLVNNKPVATGTAVKIGENFGLRVSFVGNVRKRMEAVSSVLRSLASTEGDDDVDEDSAASLAEAMLSGQ